MNIVGQDMMKTVVWAQVKDDKKSKQIIYEQLFAQIKSYCNLNQGYN